MFRYRGRLKEGRESEICVACLVTLQKAKGKSFSRKGGLRQKEYLTHTLDGSGQGCGIKRGNDTTPLVQYLWLHFYFWR